MVINLPETVWLSAQDSTAARKRSSPETPLQSSSRKSKKAKTGKSRFFISHVTCYVENVTTTGSFRSSIAVPPNSSVPATELLFDPVSIPVPPAARKRQAIHSKQSKLSIGIHERRTLVTYLLGVDLDQDNVETEPGM